MAARETGGMVALPGGAFEMGTAEEELDQLLARFGVRRRALFEAEVPRHRVALSRFELDQTPVTNAAFGRFVADRPEWGPGGNAPHRHNGEYLAHWKGGRCPDELAHHPVTYVTWHAALAYARWAGKRLPTEAEWEHAARAGSAHARFPWGDADPDPSRANYGASGIGTTTPVRSYPPNDAGLFDMAGNVWELCLDEWDAGYYGRCAAGGVVRDPIAGDYALEELVAMDAAAAARVTGRRAIRGGNWGGSAINLRVAYRDSHPPEGAGNHVGFRCARSL